MAGKKYILDWEDLSDDELLEIRVKDLNLHITDSPLEPMVQRLYEELADKGIGFRPPCYLADEWLCPDKEPIIGIPFCLAHPRLKALEVKMMYEAEGAHEKDCIKLLRHECGHAINYAYRLYARTRWRELFGRFSLHYSDIYQYRPYSRRFVVHLDDYYAQCHPDEDFAETFAVWLNPDSNWREKYQKWPALQKLEYINHLMNRIAQQVPVVTASPNPPWSAARMTSTLLAYYNRKRNQLGTEFKGYYDDSLKVVFSASSTSESSIRASKMLRQHRRLLTTHAARWTGHRKFDIHQLIHRMIQRCDALDLYTKDNLDGLIGITTLLTAIASGTHRIDTRGKI
ncbi:MAG: hypothetical protein ISS71_01760 [Phycisphaerae bacterium]|nr:hypothetical protein [Phycisphaerae bacterium]